MRRSTLPFVVAGFLVLVACDPSAFDRLRGDANMLSIKPTSTPRGFGSHVATYNGFQLNNNRTRSDNRASRVVVAGVNETRTVAQYHAFTGFELTSPPVDRVGALTLSGCISAECGPKRSGQAVGIASWALAGGIANQPESNCVFTAVTRDGGPKVEVRCESQPSTTQTIVLADGVALPEDFVELATAASTGNVVIFGASHAFEGRGALLSIEGGAGDARLNVVATQNGDDILLEDSNAGLGRNVAIYPRDASTFWVAIAGTNLVAVGILETRTEGPDSGHRVFKPTSCLRGEPGRGLGTGLAFATVADAVQLAITDTEPTNFDFGAATVYAVDSGNNDALPLSEICGETQTEDDLTVLLRATCNQTSCAQSAFGAAVALENTGRLFVGAPLATRNGVQGGTVYVFDPGQTEDARELAPSSYRVGVRFGAALALLDRGTGQELVVGSPGADDAFVVYCADGAPVGSDFRCLSRTP